MGGGVVVLLHPVALGGEDGAVLHDDAADRGEGGIGPLLRGDAQRLAHEALVLGIRHATRLD